MNQRLVQPKARQRGRVAHRLIGMRRRPQAMPHHEVVTAGSHVVEDEQHTTRLEHTPHLSHRREPVGRVAHGEVEHHNVNYPIGYRQVIKVGHMHVEA